MENINIKGHGISSFDEAQRAAWKIVGEKLGDEPVLWSWNDTETGVHSPPVECCGDDCHPAWEIYAQSRGGNLKVTVGDGRFEFFFGPSPV